MAAAPFRTVAAFAPQGAAALGLGTVSAVFGPRPGAPRFSFALCAQQPGPLETDLGVPVVVRHGPELLASADLVLVLPGLEYGSAGSPAVLDALRAARDRGATVAGHCVGVFLLAAAGLLDGLTATTHWQFADELAEAYPRVTVRPDALYVDEGPVVTGAGATSGIDLCLYLIRRTHGAAAANAIARDMVTPPHREGGQAQFVAAPVPVSGAGDARFAEVLRFAAAHLDQSLSVADLADRALMSHRSFARRFKAATGTTPHAWLRSRRLSRSEELLETTDLPVEEVARRVGYASAAVFREQFALLRGIPPTAYRRAFATRR